MIWCPGGNNYLELKEDVPFAAHYSRLADVGPLRHCHRLRMNDHTPSRDPPTLSPENHQKAKISVNEFLQRRHFHDSYLHARMFYIYRGESARYGEVGDGRRHVRTSGVDVSLVVVTSS